MVYLSNWRYKDGLLDPCAGSGTIPIEAAMIARNIAPGLTRNFAFEYWDWIERELITVERTAARKKIFPSGGYTIHGSDENPTMIDIARANSLAAGVADDIVWSIEACPTYLAAPCLQGIQTLITNPPYGERLDDGDVEGIHRTLLELFGKNSPLSGGVITSQAEFIGSSKRARLDQRKMYNGSIECKYCFRKSTV